MCQKHLGDQFVLGVYMYFHLKFNLLSCPTFLSLLVSAIHSHYQVYVYPAKTVLLYVNITFACERDANY
jgi:hypothetical protein